MNCSKIKDVLSAFIDGETDSSTNATVQAHLLRCPECRAERDRIEKIGARLRNLPPLTAPSDFEYRIYADIRNRVSSVHSRNRLNWRTVFVPAAAMMVGIIIGSIQLRSPAEIAGGGAGQSMARNLISMSPVTTDSEGLREYTIDTYIPGYSTPVTVDAIPDENEMVQPDRNRSGQSGNYASSQVNRYVLDQVPMRVGYERTIY
ncbi:zf-HC2 domain-containing protein [bacterium]|nr:zf-HC2 domain-containing protein [candidate division CSSED10-310 bacterium]